MIDNDLGSNVHPDLEKLQEFGQGLLAPEEAATVEEHLATCEECCRLLEAMPNDSFIGQLREAKDLPSPDTQPFAPRYSIPADERLDDLANHPRYRVIRLLGRGGMGAVYLAEHRRMGRLVALKVINPELLNHSGALMRFQQEVKTAAKLDHTNIVAAYDADQAGNSHFLVMEYVEGKNLSDYLAENGPLPVTQACDIIRQAALGLQHAHERGMVHRDIKPHNLMLTPSGQVKVLDFGLARFATEAASPTMAEQGATVSHLTGAGAVMGTADYIAPEQARDAHLADGRSDIYSLGCTLYHLLTGQLPFPKGTTREKLLLHSTNFPLWMRDVRPEIPEGLARVVAKMMAKKPEDRFQTAAEVAAALKPHVGNLRPKRTRVRRALIAFGAMIVVAALLAGAAWIFRPDADHGAPEVPAKRPDGGDHALAPATVGEVRRWRGHSSFPVFRIVVAPDGRSAWSVADDFRRWDVATGTTIKCVATPDRYEELLATLDGKQLLTRDRTGNIVRFHDAETMKQVRAFEFGPTHFWQAAWFPDGRRILTDGIDGFVRIWDIDTGVAILKVPGQTGIAGVAVSPDGTQFVTGHEIDGTIKVWDLSTQKVRFEIAEQICHPNSVHFVHEGKAILTCGRDGSVRLFDAKTGKNTKVFGTPEKSIPWARIALFKDGRHFVSADSDEFLRLWNMDTGQELYTVQTQFGGAASLAVTPDGRDVLIGTYHGQIVQWRLPDTATLEADGGAFSVSKEAKKPVTGNNSDHARWPLPKKTADKIWLEGYADAVWGVAFSRDGRYTLTTGQRNYLHDRSDYRIVRRLGSAVWFAAFAPDSRHALTSDVSMRGIILWDTETGQVVRRYGNPAKRGRVVNLAFSPDGKYVAASEGNVLRVYDKETAEVVMSAPTHPTCRPAFAFTPEGRLLAIHPTARSIHTYDIGTGKEVMPPLLSSDPLHTLALSPDGKTILANRADGAGVVVWESSKQDPVRRLVPSEKVKHFNDQQVAFLPDGRRALATTIDGTMILWDVPTGRQLQRWENLGGIVSLAVSPDGCWALCGLLEPRAFLLRLPEPPASEKADGK